MSFCWLMRVAQNKRH